MKWLIVAVLILAQQAAKAPEGKGTAKSNNANSAPSTEPTKSNQGTPAQASPIPPQSSVGTKTDANSSAAANVARANNQQATKEDFETQRYLVWFTGVLAAVGVGQLVVMILQWLVYRRQAREMRRQRHEMRRQRHVMYRQWKVMKGQIAQMVSTGKQTDELIKHAGNQVDALTDAAQAAKENAEAARIGAMAAENNALAASANAKALINSERPWMLLELTPVPGVPISGYLAFRFWNRGRTPAEILSYSGAFLLHGIDEPFKEDDPDFTPSELMHHEYVSPDKSVQVYGFDVGTLGPQGGVERLSQKQQYAHFYGRIVYRDLMTYESHESRFCYWLSPLPGVGLIKGGGRNWNKYT